MNKRPNSSPTSDPSGGQVHKKVSGGLLSEMPETPLMALRPGTAATTGLIRGSTFVAPNVTRLENG